MINVKFDNKDNIARFLVTGHAGYAKYGKDIVCAAVSVLAQNTVNSIEHFTQDSFTADVDEENGGLYLKMEPGYSKGYFHPGPSNGLLSYTRKGFSRRASIRPSCIPSLLPTDIPIAPAWMPCR